MIELPHLSLAPKGGRCCPPVGWTWCHGCSGLGETHGDTGDGRFVAVEVGLQSDKYLVSWPQREPEMGDENGWWSPSCSGKFPWDCQHWWCLTFMTSITSILKVPSQPCQVRSFTILRILRVLRRSWSVGPTFSPSKRKGWIRSFSVGDWFILMIFFWTELHPKNLNGHYLAKKPSHATKQVFRPFFSSPGFCGLRVPRASSTPYPSYGC